MNQERIGKRLVVTYRHNFGGSRYIACLLTQRASHSARGTFTHEVVTPRRRLDDTEISLAVHSAVLCNEAAAVLAGVPNHRAQMGKFLAATASFSNKLGSSTRSIRRVLSLEGRAETSRMTVSLVQKQRTA